MDEALQPEKAFGAVEIIIMMLIVIPDVILKLLGDIGFALPVIGQAFYLVADFYSIAAWAIIITWFVMKLGLFGGAGIVMTAGGVLDLVGIPASLLASTIVSIYLANHPKTAAMASLATAGAGAASGIAKGAGAAAEAAGGTAAAGEAAATGMKTAGAAAESGAMAAEGAGAAGEAASAAESGARAAEGAGTAGTAEGAGGASKEAFGEARPPMEELQENLLEKTPETVSGTEKLQEEPERGKSFRERMEEKFKEKAHKKVQEGVEVRKKGSEKEGDEDEPPMMIAA